MILLQLGCLFVSTRLVFEVWFIDSTKLGEFLLELKLDKMKSVLKYPQTTRLSKFNLVQHIFEVNYFSDLTVQFWRVFRTQTGSHGENQVPQTLLNTSHVVVFIGESLRTLEIRDKLIVARCAV